MKTKFVVLTILGSASLFALAQLSPGGGATPGAGNPPVGAPAQPPVGAPANPPVGAPGNPPGNGNFKTTPENPPNNGADNDAKTWHGSGNFNNGGGWHGSGSVNTNSQWHGSGNFNNHGNTGVVTNQ